MPLLSGIIALAATGVGAAVAVAEDKPEGNDMARWLRPGAWIDQRDRAELERRYGTAVSDIPVVKFTP
jgi:hypothetical protein